MSQRRRSARKIEETIGLMQKNFECAICLELMKNPVTTKCDHIFCRHCLLETIGRKKDAPCPLCKVPFTKRSLQPLLHWNQMVGAVANLIKAFETDTGAMFSPSRRHDVGTPSRNSQPKPSTSSEGRGCVTKQRKGRSVSSGVKRIQAEESTVIEVSDDSQSDFQYNPSIEETARNVPSKDSNTMKQATVLATAQNSTSDLEIIETRAATSKHPKNLSTDANDELLLYIAEGPLELLNPREKSKRTSERRGKGHSKEIKKTAPLQKKVNQSDLVEKESSRWNHLRRSRNDNSGHPQSVAPIQIDSEEPEEELSSNNVHTEDPLGGIREKNKRKNKTIHPAKITQSRSVRQEASLEKKSPSAKENKSPSTADSDVLETNLSVRENLALQPDTREKIQKWFQEQRTPQSIDLTATATSCESIDEAVCEDAFTEDVLGESIDTSQVNGERSSVLELDSEPESFHTEESTDEGFGGEVLVEGVVKTVDGVKLMQRVRRVKAHQPPENQVETKASAPAKSRSKPKRKSMKKTEPLVPVDVHYVEPAFQEGEPVLFDLSQRPPMKKNVDINTEKEEVVSNVQSMVFDPENSMIKPVTRTYGRSITPSKLRQSAQEASFAMAKTPPKPTSKFFGARGLKTPVRRKVDTVEFGAASPEDPYAFRISQRTPEKKDNTSRRSRSKKGKKRAELEMISVRQTEEVDADRNGQETLKKDETINEKNQKEVSQEEIESINEMLSMAEDHELLFSQQVRDMEEQERKHQKHRAQQETIYVEEQNENEPEVVIEENTDDVQIIGESSNAVENKRTKTQGKASRKNSGRRKRGNEKPYVDTVIEKEPRNLPHPVSGVPEKVIESPRGANSQSAPKQNENKKIMETSEAKVDENFGNGPKGEKKVEETIPAPEMNIDNQPEPHKESSKPSMEERREIPSENEDPQLVELLDSEAGEAAEVTTIPDSETTIVTKTRSRKRSSTAKLVLPETTTTRRTRSKGPALAQNWSGVKEMERDLLPQTKKLTLQKVTPEKKESKRSRRGKRQENQESEMVDLTQERELAICDKDTEESMQAECQELCYEEGEEKTESAAVCEEIPDASTPAKIARLESKDVHETTKRDNLLQEKDEMNQPQEDKEIVISDNNGTSADEVCLLESVASGANQPQEDKEIAISNNNGTSADEVCLLESATSSANQPQEDKEIAISDNNGTSADEVCLLESAASSICGPEEKETINLVEEDIPMAETQPFTRFPSNETSAFDQCYSQSLSGKTRSQRKTFSLSAGSPLDEKKKKGVRRETSEDGEEQILKAVALVLNSDSLKDDLVDMEVLETKEDHEVKDMEEDGIGKVKKTDEVNARGSQPGSQSPRENEDQVETQNSLFDASESQGIGTRTHVEETKKVIATSPKKPSRAKRTKSVKRRRNRIEETIESNGLELEEASKIASQGCDDKDVIPDTLEKTNQSVELCVSEERALENIQESSDRAATEAPITIPEDYEVVDGDNEVKPKDGQEDCGLMETYALPNSIQEKRVAAETDTIAYSIQENSHRNESDEVVPSSVQEKDDVLEIDRMPNSVQRECEGISIDEVPSSVQETDEINMVPSSVQEKCGKDTVPDSVEGHHEITHRDCETEHMAGSVLIDCEVAQADVDLLPSSVKEKSMQKEMEVELTSDRVQSGNSQKERKGENVTNSKVLSQSQSHDSTQSESLIKKKAKPQTSSPREGSKSDISEVCSLQVLPKTQDLFSDVPPTASDRENIIEIKVDSNEESGLQMHAETEETLSNSQNQREQRRTRSKRGREIDKSESVENVHSKQRSSQGSRRQAQKHTLPNSVRSTRNCSDDSSDDEVRVTPKSGRRAVRGLANRRTPEMTAQLAEIFSKKNSNPPLQSEKESPNSNCKGTEAIKVAQPDMPTAKLPKSPSVPKPNISKIIIPDSSDDKSDPSVLEEEQEQKPSIKVVQKKSPLFRVAETPAVGSNSTKKFRYETPSAMSPILPQNDVVAETPAFNNTTIQSIEETEPQNSESILLPPTPQAERSSIRKKTRKLIRKKRKSVEVKNPQPDFSDCDDEASMVEAGNKNILEVQVKKEKPSSPMAYIDEEGRYIVKALNTSTEHPVEVEDRDVDSQRERDLVLQNIEEDLKPIERNEEEKVIELPEDVCPDPEVEEEDDDDLILPSLEPPRRKPKKAENVPQSVIEVKESEDELMDEEVIRPKKKSHRYLIEDDVSVDEADIETDPGSTPSRHHLSTTCSSAFSSQSDHCGTEQKEYLEEDCEKIQNEIAQLEAQLASKRLASKLESMKTKAEDNTLTEDIEGNPDQGDQPETDDETCDITRADEQHQVSSKPVELSGKSLCVISESLPGADTADDYGQKMESLNPNEETCDIPEDGVRDNLDNNVYDTEEIRENVLSSQKSVISQSQLSSKSIDPQAENRLHQSVSSPPPPTPPSPSTLKSNMRQASKHQTDADSPTSFLDKYKTNQRQSPHATSERASRKRKLDMDVDEKPGKLPKQEPLESGASILTVENPPPAVIKVKSEEEENKGVPVSPMAASASKLKPGVSPLQVKMSPNVSSSGSYLSTQIEFPSRPNWCFVVSGVKKARIKARIEKFQELVGARVGPRITPSVTHLIVAPADSGKNQLVCQRTLKYFQAIAARKWVVSSKWVSDSMATGQLLPEDDYEIQGDTSEEMLHHGPRRSREDGGMLFAKYEMHCMGDFTNISKDELRNLVELCGGSTVQDPALFSFEPHQKQLIIVEPTGNLNLPVLRKLYHQYAVHIVGKDWILDSIGQYKQQRLTDYIISLTGDTQTQY